LPGYPS